jgi:hypothetical protein
METPGEHFRKAMKELAENCAKAKLRPNDTACDPLKLKPADPLATPEGRFAHSIKIPKPLPEDSGYKPGMTPQEYFDHLCKTEAGEFIYKTVDNVESIYMIRPRREATDYELEHLYALEDPYGYVTGTAIDTAYAFVKPNRYRYFERSLSERSEPDWKKQYRHPSLFAVPPATAKFERYFGYDARNMQTLQKEYDSTLKSRYGYTWRGITRPHDREFGIVGGEQIILDVQTNEVLAVRRGYIRSGGMKNLSGIWWLKGQVCPHGLGRAEYSGDNFVISVLKPLGREGGKNASK